MLITHPTGEPLFDAIDRTLSRTRKALAWMAENPAHTIARAAERYGIHESGLSRALRGSERVPCPTCGKPMLDLKGRFKPFTAAPIDAAVTPAAPPEPEPEPERETVVARVTLKSTPYTGV